MPNLTTKLAIPIILTGFFILVVFMAVSQNFLEHSYSLFIALLLIIFIFFFGFTVGQNIALPIKDLLDKAKELIGGNLSSRAYVETRDEIEELAAIFNKIAEELKKSREQEEKTEKSIDMKVKVRTQDLEDIINALDQKVKNRTIELERLLKESDELRGKLKKLKK